MYFTLRRMDFLGSSIFVAATSSSLIGVRGHLLAGSVATNFNPKTESVRNRYRYVVRRRASLVRRESQDIIKMPSSA